MIQENELKELIDAGVINENIAQSIRLYNKTKKTSSPNKLIIIFGILGSLLVGLGVILLIAHNWDQFSKITKTFIAFFPLLIGLIVSYYALFHKEESRAWREGASTFLFLSIGACISLISQIYHIEGNLSDFLLTWCLIGLPWLYIMSSYLITYMYILGITYFGCYNGYFEGEGMPIKNYYWILFIAILPFYICKLRKRLNSNFGNLLNYLIPLSLISCLGIIGDDYNELHFLSYMSLFSVFYLIYQLGKEKDIFNKTNGYKIYSKIGIVIILVILSFKEIWLDISKIELSFNSLISSPIFITALSFTIIGSILLRFYLKGKKLKNIAPLSLVFIFFFILFLFGLQNETSFVWVNILLFALGVSTIIYGYNQNQLGIMNYGLLILTSFVIIRFLDENISFVTKGIIFLLLGFSFYFANYKILQKRKSNEK